MSMRKGAPVLLTITLLTLCAGTSLAAAESPNMKSASAGGVTLTVRYLSQTEHESRFSVALDTHSTNLDAYDLKGLTIVRDDTGLVLQPTSVDNKGSGHHREVILTFPRASIRREWLELVVKDLAGEKERTFRWYK